MEYVSSRIYNKYFIDSYLKSIFVNFYGVRYFRILKKNRIKILVLTNYHKEYLGRLINQVNKVSVFHNYLETQEEPNLKRESRYIVYAGRISKEKGVDELISSFLKASLSDVKLKIIGIGPDLERLEDKYIKNNIEFVGEIGNNAVLEIIRNAKHHL
jgi:glycosyltransferase involved in cell wall biosynthesis